MRIVLATNDPEVDRALRECLGPAEFSEVYYREALSRCEADLAVVSAYLPGEASFAEVLFDLRRSGSRVIFLAGDLKRSDPLLLDLVALGIYDILPGEVSLEEISGRAGKPATFAEALSVLSPPARPKGLSIAGLLSRKAPREPRAEAKAPAAVEEEPLGLFPGRVVGVWSPYASGKTFAAVNLSWVLARAGASVSLVDLDPKRSVWAWLCLGQGEDSLLGSLSNPLKPPEEGFKVAGVEVFTADPDLPYPDVGASSVSRVISALRSDVVVLDLPSSSTWVRKVLGACAFVLLVGDPDFSHAPAYRAEAAGKARLLLLNRFADPGLKYWSPSEVFGREPDATVPCVPGDVYSSVIRGKPAASFSAAVREPFEAIAAKVLKGGESREA